MYFLPITQVPAPNALQSAFRTSVGGIVPFRSVLDFSNPPIRSLSYYGSYRSILARESLGTKL